MAPARTCSPPRGRIGSSRICSKLSGRCGPIKMTFLRPMPSVRKMLVHQRRLILIWVLMFIAACSPSAPARTAFNSMTARAVTGDVVSGDETGLRLRLPDDSYSKPVPWTNFFPGRPEKTRAGSQVPKVQTRSIRQSLHCRDGTGKAAKNRHRPDQGSAAPESPRTRLLIWRDAFFAGWFLRAACALRRSKHLCSLQ